MAEGLTAGVGSGQRGSGWSTATTGRLGGRPAGRSGEDELRTATAYWRGVGGLLSIPIQIGGEGEIFRGEGSVGGVGGGGEWIR